MKTTPQQRFWSHVKKQNGHLIWTAHRNRAGYGCMRAFGKIRRSHQVSWMLHHGPIPPGLWVLHKCSRRECVDPLHLYLGTAQDNANDRQRDGNTAIGSRNGRSTMPHRTQRGERSGRAKLAWLKVCEIRNKYSQGNRTQLSLSKEYKMALSTIGHITSNRIWKAAR